MRSHALADRIEAGAKALETLAAGLDEAQWRKALPGDGRSVGVVIHHVASVYPIEVQLAEKLARGEDITGVTWSGIAEMNAGHAKDHASVTKEETIDLLRRNSKAAADAVRRLTDAQLDSAARVSLNADAPLTAQFMLEDHAVRHSFHHLEKIRAALGKM
jgi:hypothetical protein